MFPLVYEINTRVWLRQLSERCQCSVTLGNVPDNEFDFFQRSGFDIVWLMGVWQPSIYSEAIARSHRGLRSSFLEQIDQLDPLDIVSSPYSISDYRVSPLLGDESGLAVFRERLAGMGIRLMLDFVPNHMALDNRWLPEHPEYFITMSAEEQCADPESCFEYRHNHFLAHGRDPYFPPWTDTLQLNYWNYATHEMMIENLMTIAGQCDGVRCDVAMLILKEVYDTTWGAVSGPMPEEFWPKAISTVRQKYPDFLFLAESYWNKEWILQEQGFDFTYDKPFYDGITSHPVSFSKLKGHLKGKWGYQSQLCRFLENHDEERAARKLGPNHCAAALVMMTVPGMHLIHQGQLEGYRLDLPVQLLRQPSEPFNSELPAFYQKLFRLSNREVFRRGHIEPLDLHFNGLAHCLGYRRYTDDAWAFVIVNFSSTGVELEFAHECLAGVEPDRTEVFSTRSEQKPVGLHVGDGCVKLKLTPHEAVVVAGGW